MSVSSSELRETMKMEAYDFESSYNADYGIDDGASIPFIHNRYELQSLLRPLYILEDYAERYERYDAFFQDIYNIVKGCYTIQVCREFPVKFKFYKSDKEVHTCQLRHFLIGLMSWRPIAVALYGIHVLDATFIMDPKKDIRNLDDWINNKVIIPLREHHVKTITVNTDTAEVMNQFRWLSSNFAVIMNLSFGMDTFIDAYQNNDEVREIMDATYSDLGQPSEIEQRINGFQHRLIDIYKADPLNGIGIILNADAGIKHKQLSEFAIAEGLKPSIDGKTIPIAIENSTINGGLTKPSYLYIDAIGARKSLLANKKTMGKAGYFGKCLTLLVRTISMSQTVADCGSKHLIPYEIKTKKHLDKLDGKYYKFHPSDEDYNILDRNEDAHLIGQTLYFRSIATCTLKDQVCPRCIGLTANINQDIADGFAAFQAEETTKKVNQDILSTKHLLTTNSEMVRFSADFSDYFTMSNADVYPLVNNNETFGDEINRYGIYINPSDVSKVSEMDEDSLYNSVIETGRVYIRDLEGKKDDILVCTINENGEPEDREMYISEDAMEIMKRNKNVIPFREIDDETKLFEITIYNNELTKPLYDMMSLINTKKKVEGKTIAEMCQMLLDLLIDANIGATATSSEMIINRMIRRPDDTYERPDFTREEEPDYIIVPASHALEKNPSPYIGLSYQCLKRQMISDDLYTKRHGRSFVDPLFQMEVPMDNLKKYANYVDPEYQNAYKKKQEERRAKTFLNPEYSRRFKADFSRDRLVYERAHRTH